MRKVAKTTRPEQMTDRARSRHAWLALATNLILALTAACGGSSGSSDPASTPAPFQFPEPVAILGYDEDAMEPFLSCDGALLFFNNSVCFRTSNL